MPADVEINFFNILSGTLLSVSNGSDPDQALERSGSVLEFLTRDRGVAGSSLTGVTACIVSLSKIH